MSYTFNPFTSNLDFFEAAAITFVDNTFRIFDNGDATKQIAFEASGITPATTRTLTVPDADGTIALTSDNIGTFGFSIGDGDIVLTTGQKGYVRLPFAGTITGWSIQASGSSPTCTIDVWKIATGTTLPAVGQTIMGTKPALSTGNAIASTTLTSWTTAITADDIIGFNLDAVTNATFINFIITYTKT